MKNKLLIFFSFICIHLFSNEIPSYVIEDLGVLEFDESEAIAINDKNQVLGKLKANGCWHFFIWEKEKGLKIIYLPEGCKAMLNNHGQIACSSPLGVHLWDSVNGLSNIGPIDGGKLTVERFNDLGQLIISSNHLNNETKIYFWKPGKIVNLTEEFKKHHSHYTSIAATSLNNKEEVTITGCHAHGTGPITKSYLWKNGSFQKMCEDLSGKTVLVSERDDEGNFFLLTNDKSFFVNSAGQRIAIDLLHFWRPHAIKNGIPIRIGCTPPKLKKALDGSLSYSHSIEIRKIIQESYPYWFNDDEWEKSHFSDQNSHSCVVGTANTIYTGVRHAFLAIPKGCDF